MFGNKINTESLVPTSKLSLKLSCLQACGNDVDKATKLYDYIAAGMDLPDTDPIEPSGFEKFKNSTLEILGWVDQNQDRIIQGINIIKGLKAAKSASPDIPPIPDEL